MKRVIVFCFLLLSITFIYGQFENTIITVSDAIVEEGDTLLIEVSTTGVLYEWDVIAFQFDLAFDESLIQYEGVTLGDMPLPANLIANEFEPGIIRVAYANYLNISGAGNLVTIEFSAIGEGDTALDIYDFKYNSTFLEDENLLDGTVTVVVPNPFSDVVITVDSPEAGLTEPFDLAVLTSELTTEMGGISFQFILIYDPGMMTFTGVYGLGDVPNMGNFIANETSPGVINVAYANVASITGDGSLCTIEFQPAGEEGESIVSLDSFKYNSTNLFNLEAGTVYFLGGPQEIEISKEIVSGWNWFSVNVVGEDMGINSVLSSIGNNGANIKNQSQSAIFYENVGWWGSLEDINNLSLYKLEADSAATWEYTGMPVDLASTTYDLSGGWNWISYAPQEPEDINYALDGLENGANIKNQSQSAIYYESVGWWGSLSTLQPQDGYMLQMDADQEFIYPLPAVRHQSVYSRQPAETYDDFNPHAYEYNAVLIASSDQPIAEDSHLIACCEGETRSICQILDYTSQFGRKFYSLMLYSNELNEADFQLYYRESAGSKMIEVSPEITFLADMTMGDFINPVIIDLNYSDNEDVLEPQKMITVYPNPFNPETNIHFELAEPGTAFIEIYNVKGQKLETLLNCELSAGKHWLTWNPQNQSSGIYLLNFQTADTKLIRKLILLK